jgi:invasion protein IalB
MNNFAGLARILAALALVAAAASTEAMDANAATQLAQAASDTPTPPLRPSSAAAAATGGAAPAAKPAPVPTRTEILNFDNWVVTCSEFAEGPKRQCAAILRIAQQNTNQVVFVWTITVDANKQATAVVQTPSGVNIAPGVELRVGKAPPVRLPFTSCEPNGCAATAVMEAPLLKEMATAAAAEAIVQSTQGKAVQFNIQMKGFDRAYSALSRT